MTLAIAWVRKLKDGTEELLIAADSRLGGGLRLDCCPKIMMLPRSDSIICFAGETEYAYPLMLQLYLAIDAHSPLKDRSMDIHELVGHTLRVFNSMRDSVHSFAAGMDVPKVSFILGGYSWMSKEFSIWLIQFDKTIGKFIHRPFKRLVDGFGPIAFAGDWSRKGRHLLIQMLRERYDLTVSRTPVNGLDMEPFEILREILRESKPEDSVGGPPQLVKVYQHMNSRPIAVFWPDNQSQRISLLGRPLLGYENTDYWILDPDTLQTSHQRYVKTKSEVTTVAIK